MKKMIRPALWTAFRIYCFILIYIVFLSRGAMIHYSYAQYFRQFTNFIPFKTIIEYVQRYYNGFRNLSVINLLGNFVLFDVIGAMIGYGLIRLPFIYNFFKKINLIKGKDSVPEKE